MIFNVITPIKCLKEILVFHPKLIVCPYIFLWGGGHDPTWGGPVSRVRVGVPRRQRRRQVLLLGRRFLNLPGSLGDPSAPPNDLRGGTPPNQWAPTDPCQGAEGAVGAPKRYLLGPRFFLCKANIPLLTY